MKTLKFILIVSIIILSQKMVFAKDIKVPGVYISSSEEHDLLGTSTLKITCAMVSTSACYTISTGMAINTDFDPLKQHGELEIENQYNSIDILDGGVFGG
jgi:hypothetical protein